jgi:outer membrane receptor protein involved in Fe transport
MNRDERTVPSGCTRRDRRMLETLLVSTLLLAGARADAQSTPAQASATAGRSDNDVLGEIIVTAQKRAEPLQKVPISITVLSGALLDKQEAGGTLDALRLTPSVTASDSDAGGLVQISIRGVAPAVAFGDSSTTVAYYVDGVPFASIRSAAVPQTSDYDLQQIEVLRGPQGTLYGASALAGVVHIITSDADPSQFYGKARLGMATTDGGALSYRTDAALNLPVIQDNLAIRLVADYDHQGGWIEQPNLNRTNANSSTLKSFRGKVDYRPTDNLTIDLTAWHSDFQEDAANYGIDNKQSLTFNPSPSTTQYDAYNAKIAYDASWATLTSSTSNMHLVQHAYTDYDNEIGTITRDANDELHLYLPSNTFTEEVLVNSKDSGAWRWQSGAFYRKEHDDAFHAIPAFFGTGNITWRDGSESEAVFGQVTRLLDDGHFEVTAGARYFHDKFYTKTLMIPGEVLPYLNRSDTSSSVTPRVVLAWLPNPNTNIYASYSVGFRSGLEQSPFVLVTAPQFPPARPDKLKNYEVGAKGVLFDNLVTYDVSVFYMKWVDVQQNGELQYCTTPTTCAPLGGTVNGVSASGTGFDFGLALHPVRGWNVGFNIDENDLTNDAAVYPNGIGVGPNNGAVYLKGDRTPFSAKWTAKAYTDYSWPLSETLDAKAQLSGDYRSSQLLILAYNSVGGINYQPCNNGSYCYTSDSPRLVNARFELANHHNQSLSFYATNLTNWNGLMIPAASANTTFRTRPRTFGLQFEATFK